MRNAILVGAIVVALLAGLGLGRYVLSPTLPSSILVASPPSAATSAGPERRIKIQMASAYPSSAPELGTLGLSLLKKVARASNGMVEIKFVEPGILMPNSELFDAVAEGALDAAWSNPSVWADRNSAFALFGAVPFGPAAPEYLAWLYQGGGRELAQELFGRYKVIALPCGIVPPEAAGWFRREIKGIDDFKGLKMRTSGFGARVMEKLGVSTEAIAGGEIFQALQLGTIDASEFSMPAIDLLLGFHQVVKHYYFPGWHQQTSFLYFMIGQQKWAELNDSQRAQIEAVCGDNIREGLAEGEAIQFKALQELQAQGVKFHTWSPEILTAITKAWEAVVAEEIAQNPDFERIWLSYSAFRNNSKLWRDLGYLR